MNNKKKVFVISLFMSIYLFIIKSVSAAFPFFLSPRTGFFDIRYGSQMIVNFIAGWASPFLVALLGGYGLSYFLLFEKFLFFVLLICIIYVVLSKISLFEDQKKIIIVIDVCVSLLAVRFLDFIWLNTILVQYQLLGIVLTAILPFIIYLFFLHGISNSGAVRKIGWIFFIVVYFFLWSTNEFPSYTAVYFWTMLLSFVFLLLDGTIHRYFQQERWREADRASIMNALNHTNGLIRQYQDPIAEVPENLRRKELKRLNKRKIDLKKQLT